MCRNRRRQTPRQPLWRCRPTRPRRLRLRRRSPRRQVPRHRRAPPFRTRRALLRRRQRHRHCCRRRRRRRSRPAPVRPFQQPSRRHRPRSLRSLLSRRFPSNWFCLLSPRPRCPGPARRPTWSPTWAHRCWSRASASSVLPAASLRGGPSTLADMTPVEALERVVHCLDRAHDTGFKTKAFVRALEVVRATPPDELVARSEAGTLTDLEGIGDSTARLITETLHGDTSYVDKIEAETGVKLTDEGAKYRTALKGDCHLHSLWSDGGATIESMARTARGLGHEYMVLTDHSPRLTIAHGLSRERLDQQLADVAILNEKMAPFRILTGIEVDILEDGALDHSDEVLSQLDVVVASVHSKLRMERPAMTERMVRAVASPHVDILGHCTGRLIGKRDQSAFDADYVFAACAQFRTAVEITCRPERLAPPRPLLKMAIDYGCYFSIDTDAHATGQLEWQPHGGNRAAECDVPLDRGINTWDVEDLLRWVQAA